MPPSSSKSSTVPYLDRDLEDQTIFPSKSQVNFDASKTWDIDNDTILFTWTSNIDGAFAFSDNFTVNDGSISEIPLSDGIHDITLEVCDTAQNCVQETGQLSCQTNRL